jgi:Tfp pilus assembly protein PilO
VNRRNEQLITVAIALGVAGLFVFAVHLPQRRHFTQLEQDFKQQEENLSKAKEEYSQLTDLNKKVIALRKVVARQYKRIPAKGEFGSSLEQIVAVLNSAKLVTEEISPQSPVSEDKFSELPINICFKGEFNNICLFLAGLESMDRLVRIENLRLEGDGSSTPVIKAKMVLNIYCSRS